MSTLSDPTHDPLPPQRPLERFAHLEADTFCEGCGYNLHGQIVQRDERLGLMICRCPECGRYHPAGHKTAATSLWLSRFAALGLFLWVLVVLAVITLACIAFGAIQVLHVEAMSYITTVDAQGREIDHQPIGPGGAYVAVYAGTTQPVVNAGRTRNVRTFTPSPRMMQFQTERPWWIPLIILGFAAGSGIAAGMLLVTFLWHWDKRNYVWTVLLPLATAGFVCTMIYFDDWYDLIRAWSLQRVVMWGLIETAFMYIGILIGRPFARLLLRMFVPPRPRQHLAFLWHADGKVLPPVTAGPR